MKSEQLAAYLLKHPGTEVLLSDSNWADGDHISETVVAYVDVTEDAHDTRNIFDYDEVYDPETDSVPPVFRKVLVLTKA